ncbi:MAG: NosD domain-containing protein [Candidatus Bathyarchaeia archaeon]
MLTPAFSTRSIKAKPEMIIVPDDYATIQEAINNATEGDTVYVRAGVYNESININKSIQLVGEDKATTVIDGSGSGIVVKVSANNVSIVNFTIRNAGKMWDGVGYPPSCVSGNSVRYIEVKDNILTDAAVCVWFSSSSFIEISSNVAYNGTVAGIITYASSNIVVQKNLVNSCGMMGIHLDGNCMNCNIIENTVMNTLEGIEIEKSGKNLITRNQLLHNNVSMVLNQCNELNTLRENNMTSDWYNLIVWGAGINAFLHDIDTTNIVNRRKIYYFVNYSGLLVNSSSLPDIGYLAFVNCTRVTVKDIDLSFNRDGLLLAKSTYCNLENMTIRGNRGPLLHGGLTLFNSTNNMITYSIISNNTVGVCAYQSNGNVFHHNNFIDNAINVISNYLSPFQLPQSTVYSRNVWDAGYPSGGNYWSNYRGVDWYSGPYQNETGSDGIADFSYRIDDNNQDRYPLMGKFYDFEVIGLDSKMYHVQVISNSTVSELNLFQWLNSPNEYLQPGQEFLLFFVEGEIDTSGFCRITIPRALLNDPYIVLVDWAMVPVYQLGASNSTHAYLYFTYNHTKHEVIIIPEFPSATILLTLLSSSLITITAWKVKKKNNVK